MPSAETIKKERKYYFGLDYLRAACVVSVIVWHTNLFSPLYGHGFDHWLEIITFNCVQLLAVPIFFTIAFFLYAKNRQTDGQYFFSRVRRLLIIVLAWMLITTSFSAFFFRYNFPGALKGVDKFIDYLTSGGSLSPYYFLFSLLVLTLIAEVIFRSLKKIRHRLSWLISGLIIAVGLIIAALVMRVIFEGGFPGLTVFKNPLNFLSFVFIGNIIYVLLQRTHSTRAPLKLGVIFLAVALIMALIEWRLLPNYPYWDNDFILPMYTRPSLVFEAGAILLFFLSIRTAPPNWIAFISRYSLGLYCVHPLILYLLIPTFRYRTSVADKLLLFSLVAGGALILTWLCTKLIPASRRILI